jgi:hypothetical protein
MYKFNLFFKQILSENNTAGGAMSVFGDVQATANAFSGDNYATGDSRLPKYLGKGVMRRTKPELTVFATGISNNNGKSKQKQGKKRGSRVRKSSK